MIIPFSRPLLYMLSPLITDNYMLYNTITIINNAMVN